MDLQVQKKGLKFGLQHSIGKEEEHVYFENDVKTFEEWGVEYLKINYVSATSTSDLEQTLIKFGEYLLKSSRPIFYSCPLFLMHGQIQVGKSYIIW